MSSVVKSISSTAADLSCTVDSDTETLIITFSGGSVTATTGAPTFTGTTATITVS